MLLTVAVLASVTLSPAQAETPSTAQRVAERVQKALDLQRARANRGVSPDRVVVVYETPVAESDAHPDRRRARQQLGGRLLRADVELGRDVIRVPAGNAEVIAQRIRLLPGVEDAFADPLATLSATVNDATPSSQWGLFRILGDMAWEATTAQDVEVAVLDCGVYAHADLAVPHQRAG